MRIAMFGRVLLVSFALVTASGAFGQDELVTVTVTGEGMTRDAARYDALRKAVEKAGENEISSHSRTENFELIRDTVYARAEGIVSDYTVVKWADGVGGTVHCTIRARVSRSAVASTWGEVQNVLDQLGRPVITVFIEERIDGVIQRSSILESRIERRLLDAGFDVKAGQQVRAIAERESHDAQTEGNVIKVQAIAKDFGSQIYITGNAQANAAGIRQLAGQATAMYNCDADIRMFYTDTGQLLASESLPQTRGGARGFFERSPQAGKQALATAGDGLVEMCYISVMKRWATRITAGGEIVLEIEGMSYGDARKFERNLKGLDPDKIRSVNFSLTKGIATFRIQAKMTGTGLADALFETDWASGVIEILDVKTNRIQAKRVGS